MTDITDDPRTTNPLYPPPRPARYAKLPRTPRTASPVPRLTSLYHTDADGGYGDQG